MYKNIIVLSPYIYRTYTVHSHHYDIPMEDDKTVSVWLGLPYPITIGNPALALQIVVLSVVDSPRTFIFYFQLKEYCKR